MLTVVPRGLACGRQAHSKARATQSPEGCKGALDPGPARRGEARWPRGAKKARAGVPSSPTGVAPGRHFWQESFKAQKAFRLEKKKNGRVENNQATSTATEKVPVRFRSHVRAEGNWLFLEAPENPARCRLLLRWGAHGDRGAGGPARPAIPIHRASHCMAGWGPVRPRPPGSPAALPPRGRRRLEMPWPQESWPSEPAHVERTPRPAQGCGRERGSGHEPPAGQVVAGGRPRPTAAAGKGGSARRRLCASRSTRLRRVSFQTPPSETSPSRGHVTSATSL